MRLYGANPLFESLDSFMELAVREVNERASFPELIVQVLAIISVTLAEMHLKPFGHKLKFMPEFFSKEARVAFRIGDIRPKRFRRNISVPLDAGNVRPKGFGRSFDNLLNLGQRFLFHIHSLKISAECRTP
jgi:hypothetical protein